METTQKVPLAYLHDAAKKSNAKNTYSKRKIIHMWSDIGALERDKPAPETTTKEKRKNWFEKRKQKIVFKWTIYREEPLDAEREEKTEALDWFNISDFIVTTQQQQHAAVTTGNSR